MFLCSFKQHVRTLLFILCIFSFVCKCIKRYHTHKYIQAYSPHRNPFFSDSPDINLVLGLNFLLSLLLLLVCLALVGFRYLFQFLHWTVDSGHAITTFYNLTITKWIYFDTLRCYCFFFLFISKYHKCLQAWA